MDLIITILPVVTKDLPISPRFTAYNFLLRCKFSTLTTRQPMVDYKILYCTPIPTLYVVCRDPTCLLIYSVVADPNDDAIRV